MKPLILVTLLFSFCVGDELISIEDDFLQSLDEVSEIATKTKLNIDDTPSLVTVLHSKKLQKLGIDNVFEALAQVPGVQLKREATGVPVVVFRGVTSKGEVKLMVDGVTINNTYRGSIYHYLNFPIELIERIEVIRGAGSVLYGSGAISGVVNIITKSSNDDTKNTLFLSGGTYDNYRAGAIVSTTLKDIKFSADAYYQNSEKMIDATDRHLIDFSVGMNLKSQHFTFIARVKKSEQGDAYGVLGVPDKSRSKYDNTNASLNTELAYSNSIAKYTDITVLAGYSQYGQSVEAAHPSPTIDTAYADYKELSYYGQIDLKSKILENNEFLIGSKFESAKTLKSQFRKDNTISSPIVNSDSKRDIFSLYINDQYSVTSDLGVSAGLRYDNYSDFGDAFSPTIGVVYKLNKQFTFKALYAEAFRAPSWVELTSNNGLEAETSSSYEAGIIYKKDQSNTIRINAYNTQLNDMITKNTSRKYVQTSYAKFTGTEIEYIFSPNNQVDLHLFGSYIQAKDQDGEDLKYIANILATASLIYELDSGLNLGSLVKYKSNHTRSRLIVDETFSYAFKDITASLVIKDIFDKGTFYQFSSPSTYESFNDGGRNFLLKATWQF